MLSSTNNPQDSIKNTEYYCILIFTYTKKVFRNIKPVLYIALIKNTTMSEFQKFILKFYLKNCNF